MLRLRVLAVRLLILVAAGLLATQTAFAQQMPPGASKMWPWNVQGYQGYSEARRPAPVATPTLPPAPPQKYTLQVMAMPKTNPAENPNTVVLVAHLPENAEIWFEEFQSRQKKAEVRLFESPPLKPGQTYHYTVNVNWFEEGQRVSQARTLRVKAGEIQCIDLVPYDSLAPDSETRVEVNLAKLSPEDRKLAEQQQFCAVQEEGRLGSMGVPVKVTVKGEVVFVCCKGCVEKAQSNPDKAVAKAQALKAKIGVIP
jgi:uncharacterized protein (TIGR03000 family)